MKQAVTTLLAVTLACSGLLSQERSNEYTFRSNAELVLVNVTVRDKSGNPVRDLKREDFTVMEDSKPQQVVSFDLENTDAALPTAASELSLLGADQGHPATSKQPGEASPLKDRRLIVLFFDLSSMQTELLICRALICQCISQQPIFELGAIDFMYQFR